MNNEKIQSPKSVPTFRDFLKANTQNPGYEGLLATDALRDPNWAGNCIQTLAQALRKNCNHPGFQKAFKVLAKKYKKLKSRQKLKAGTG